MSELDMSTTTPTPLKPAVLHILLALAEQPRHGYAIMQAVREAAGSHLRLNTASFYRHLGKLIDAGFVTEAGARPREDDPRRGAYYRLTPAGRAALLAERERLASLLAAVDGLRLAIGRNRR
jgi:DNA-binding PadR family transcriptional regulator